MTTMYNCRDESPWLRLSFFSAWQLLGPDSDEAAGILDTIVSPPNTAVQLTMSGGDFLDAVTPGITLAPSRTPSIAFTMSDI